MINLGLLLIGLTFVVLSSCGGNDSESSFVAEITTGGLTSSEEVIEINEPFEPVTLGSKKLALEASIGSGAFHDAKDPADEMYALTDRGPVIPCQQSGEILGIVNFCRNSGQPDENGEIFAMPQFTPTIYKLNLDLGGVAGTKVGYTVTQFIKIRDRNGTPIYGTPNPLQRATIKNGYDTRGSRLDFNPDSLDPEALIRLSNGTFWLADEYAPSLVHVTADGKILERIVPAGLESDLAMANYRVLGNLPAILKKRVSGRGIEGLAVSPDERFLYFILQSPLANPDESAYKKSRQVRLFKVSLLNFDMDRMVGEYVYTLDKPEEFTADATSAQSDVTVSEMVVLNSGKLIIVERVMRQTRLYQVATLDTATNILGTEWDNENKSAPTLEQLTDLTAQGMTAVQKKLVIDSRRDISDLDFNIEGLALLDQQYVAFLNDNNYGMDGKKTNVRIKKLYQVLDN